MPSFALGLEETLHGAIQLADHRRHEYSTIEHLLLALTNDESASEVMAACGVNLDDLRETVTSYLDTELDSLKVPVERPKLTKKEELQLEAELQRLSAEKDKSGRGRELPNESGETSDGVRLALSWEQFEREGASPTAGFQRVVQRSILHAQSSGRDEVDGARVLVALFSERDSYAVYFLQQHKMSRLDAVSYIRAIFDQSGSYPHELK